MGLIDPESVSISDLVYGIARPSGPKACASGPSQPSWEFTALKDCSIPPPSLVFAGLTEDRHGSLYSTGDWGSSSELGEIPAPGALLLFVSGLVILAFMNERRRNASK